MKISVIPFLFAVIFPFLAFTVRRAARQGHLDRSGSRSAYFLLIVLLLWGITSSALALTGIYSSASFLALLPGVWLPLVPLILALGGTLIFPRLRSALRSIVDNTPQHWWMYFQALRILALGTIIKAAQGVFPAYFAFPVGIPDMLFGISALLLGFAAHRRPLSNRLLMVWNLIGIVIILPASPLMQMGLPGPLQFFVSEPTAERLLDFPMVLAPSLIVPMFILLNTLIAWRLFETRQRD